MGDRQPPGRAGARAPPSLDDTAHRPKLPAACCQLLVPPSQDCRRPAGHRFPPGRRFVRRDNRRPSASRLAFLRPSSLPSQLYGLFPVPYFPSIFNDRFAVRTSQTPLLGSTTLRLV